MLLRSFCAVTAAVLLSGITLSVVASSTPGRANITALLPALPAAQDKSDEKDLPFTVDIGHSTVLFRIRHFGVSSFYGRINQPTGSFRIDDNDLAGSFVNVDIEISKIDAGSDARNRLLMGPDFFNAREYPAETFKSSSLKKISDGVYEATGTFTMHGVSKEITVPIVGYTTKQTERFGHRAGFECTFEIERSDYGMDMFVKEGTLGNTVRIIVAIQGVQRPE